MQVLFLYFPIDILHLSCWFKWDRVQFYLSVLLYSSPLFPLSPSLCYLSLVFNDLPPVLFPHHFIFLIVSFLPLSSVLILSSSITLSLSFLSQPAPTTLLSLSLCVCVCEITPAVCSTHCPRCLLWSSRHGRCLIVSARSVLCPQSHNPLALVLI